MSRCSRSAVEGELNSGGVRWIDPPRTPCGQTDTFETVSSTTSCSGHAAVHCTRHDPADPLSTRTVDPNPNALLTPTPTHCRSSGPPPIKKPLHPPVGCPIRCHRRAKARTEPWVPPSARPRSPSQSLVWRRGPSRCRRQALLGPIEGCRWHRPGRRGPKPKVGRPNRGFSGQVLVDLGRAAAHQ